MAVIRSTQYVRHCPRCFEEIKVGSPLERFEGDRWAHMGCRAVAGAVRPVAQTAAAQTAGGDGGGLDLAALGALVGDAINNAETRLGDSLKTDLRERLDRAADAMFEANNDTRAELQREIAERLTRIEKQTPVPKYVVIRSQTVAGVTEKAAEQGEIFHSKFERILRLCAAGKNVFVPGPTGLGKTHIFRQVARYIPNPDGTFGRPFGMIANRLNMPESEILGRSIPDLHTGKNVYHRSDFVRCFEEGGVFLLDEVDAGDPNTLLTLNSAIANGILPVPARTEKPYAERHPLFVCGAAANTWGGGADRQYCGRFQLDEATLDRFRAYMVPLDYCHELERRLCPHEPLYTVLNEWRAKIRANNLERIMSTRFIAEAYDSVSGPRACQSFGELMESYFGGWTADESAAVLGQPFVAAAWAKAKI